MDSNARQPHTTPQRARRRRTGGLALVAALLCALRSAAVDTSIECDILYQTADGVFVNAGAGEGLRSGVSGWLERNGERVAQVEVRQVSSESTFLRVLARLRPGFPVPGARYALVVEAADAPDAERAPTSPTLKPQGSEDDPFVPLLARPGRDNEVATEASNVFHGRLTLQQLFGASSEGDHDYYITRLRSSGSLERIAETPWTLEWSGDLSYRDGDGLERVRSFQEPRLEVYRLNLFRRFDDRSFVRMGRFIPRELPSVGYLDGFQGERALTSRVRAGGALGFRPDRVTLSPSLRELTLAPYATYATAPGGDWEYSGTGGFLFSLYEGEADRAALLADQSLRSGPFHAYSSTEIDLDAGAAETRTGVRLTRWDLLLSYVFDALLTARAGFVRFERPDTEAERDAVRAGALAPAELLDDDYWRFWIGADHELPFGLRLREEVSYTDAFHGDGFRWLVSLTRLGLPCFVDGSATLAVYSIEGVESNGVGARLSANVPALEGRLYIEPAVAVRAANVETQGASFFRRVSEDFLVVDVSLRAQWSVARSWLVSGGLGYVFTRGEDQMLGDLAVTFRW